MKVDEQERLRELERYQVLDTGPEEAFDELVRVAAHVCGTPIALVSLVDAERQWFKARLGLAATETPREVAFCAHAVRDDLDLMVVPDARADARFAQNPLVTGEPRVGFYAGAVVRGRSGAPLGTLCVIDHGPRQLDDSQRAALVSLSRQVERQLELRRTVQDLRDAVAARGRAEDVLRQRVALLMSSSASTTLEVPRRRWAGLSLVVATVLALTALAAADRVESERLEALVVDQRAVDEVATALGERLEAYDALVRAARALFQASTSVEPAEWATFVGALDVDRHHPGVHRLGFAASRAGAEAVHAEVLLAGPARGASDAAVLGADLGRDPARRAALEWSRDHGETSATSTTGLLSTGEPAVALFAPVYRGAPVTLEERRARLEGWVFATVRLGRLAQDLPAAGALDLAVTDDRGAKVFERGAPREAGGDALVRSLRLGDRPWVLEARARGSRSPMAPLLVAGAGALLAALVGVLGASLLRRRQRAEQDARHLAKALRDLEQRTRIVLDHIADGVVVYRRSGTLESLNPAAEAMLGWTLADALGRDIGLVLPGVAREADAPGGSGRELDLPRRDGSTLHAEVAVRQAKVGPDPLLVAVVKDVTTRRETERQKREFLAVVSHELRTPLTAIKGSLELLAGGFLGDLPPEAVEVAALAERNSQRLTTLVNDLLTLERLDCGKLDVVLADAPIGDVVQRAIEAVSPIAATAGVTLEQDVAPAMARADAGRLGQVLINLLANAIKFSPRGERVLVRAAPAAAGRRVSVRVEDRGRGIPKAALGELFRRFSQVDRGDEREKGGMGLGLVIARRIVELHAGTIGVESEEGRGSTFWFEVPAAGVPAGREGGAP